jgi:parvulin-like peptidyl-prolyl isomerase
MKKFAAFILLGITLFYPLSLRAEIVDGIVAVVNNEVITQAELNTILLPIYSQYKATYSDEELLKKIDEAKKNILYQLIEDKLILQEAEKIGVSATDEEVDERLQQIKSQFSSSDEFRDALASQGLTVVDLKEKYKEQIMIKKMVNREVRSRVSITPIEIALFYEKNKEDFKVPAQVKVMTIMVRKNDQDPEANTESLKKVKMIELKIAEGEDFAKLAREYSQDPSAVDGGDMGYISQGQMMKKIDEVIFSLKPGEISQTIETPVGYHIFKIVEVKEAGAESFDDARLEIENYLFQEKAKERFDEWMAGLKENAYISVK